MRWGFRTVHRGRQRAACPGSRFGTRSDLLTQRVGVAPRGQDPSWYPDRPDRTGRTSGGPGLPSLAPPRRTRTRGSQHLEVRLASSPWGTRSRDHDTTHGPRVPEGRVGRAGRRLALPGLGGRGIADARGGGRVAERREPSAPLAGSLAAADQRRHRGGGVPARESAVAARTRLAARRGRDRDPDCVRSAPRPRSSSKRTWSPVRVASCPSRSAPSALRWRNVETLRRLAYIAERRTAANAPDPEDRDDL